MSTAIPCPRSRPVGPVAAWLLPGCLMTVLSAEGEVDDDRARPTKVQARGVVRIPPRTCARIDDGASRERQPEGLHQPTAADHARGAKRAARRRLRATGAARSQDRRGVRRRAHPGRCAHRSVWRQSDRHRPSAARGVSLDDRPSAGIAGRGPRAPGRRV